MLAEKIIFTILTLYLLITMFFKLIKRGDKIYIPILVCGLLGIILGVIQIIFDLNFNIFVKTMLYVVGIIVPILVIFVERKGKNLSEIFYLALVSFYEFTRK